MNTSRRTVLGACFVTIATVTTALAQCPYVYSGFRAPTTRTLFESQVRALGGPTPTCTAEDSLTVCKSKIPLADGRLEASIVVESATRPIDRLMFERFDEVVDPDRASARVVELTKDWGSSTETQDGTVYRSGQCIAVLNVSRGMMVVRLFYLRP